jgi:hypothetical protein
MSLAIYAAPFHSDNEEIDILNEKKIQNKHNKTQKMQNHPSEKQHTEKVKSILERIHQRNGNDESDSDNDNENDEKDVWKPPSPPVSSGVTKTIERENMTNNVSFRNPPQPMNHEADNEVLNYYPKTAEEQEIQSKEYYEKVLPGYLKSHLSKIAPPPKNHSLTTNDLLLKKMNYMIHLLEDKQDEKTEHVTEEVILYSFLGIFIIYIVDSFVKVGKYVR